MCSRKTRSTLPSQRCVRLAIGENLVTTSVCARPACATTPARPTTSSMNRLTSCSRHSCLVAPRSRTWADARRSPHPDPPRWPDADDRSATPAPEPPPELLSPVQRNCCSRAFSRQPASLPDRIVRVLNRQRWQGIILVKYKRAVQQAQFLAHQHPHRPGRPEMMWCRLTTSTWSSSDNCRSHTRKKRTTRQVERTRGPRISAAAALRLPFGCVQGAAVSSGTSRSGRLLVGFDHLSRLTLHDFQTACATPRGAAPTAARRAPMQAGPIGSVAAASAGYVVPRAVGEQLDPGTTIAAVQTTAGSSPSRGCGVNGGTTTATPADNCCAAPHRPTRRPSAPVNNAATGNFDLECAPRTRLITCVANSERPPSSAKKFVVHIPHAPTAELLARWVACCSSTGLRGGNVRAIEFHMPIRGWQRFPIQLCH